MNYRHHGFNQRKPTDPGVYFVSAGEHLPMSPPPRMYEGWEVAEVYFFAGSYSNVHENREEFAHWRVKTLGGIEYAWRPGIWLKGPISAKTPNVSS